MGEPVDRRRLATETTVEVVPSNPSKRDDVTAAEQTRVDLAGGRLTVKGPKGTLTHSVAAPITVEHGDDGVLEVKRPDDERLSKSLHGLTRTLINNMVVGVTDGFKK